MVGFAIPIPEGSKPEGNALDAEPTARLLASEAGRHGVERSGSLACDAKQGCPDIDARLVCRRGVGPRAQIMKRSGHGDRTHYIRHHHD
jgi:hypothetical protein